MWWLFLRTLNPEFVHYIIWDIHKASPINKGALIHPPVSDCLKYTSFTPQLCFSWLEQTKLKSDTWWWKVRTNTQRLFQACKQLPPTMEVCHWEPQNILQANLLKVSRRFRIQMPGQIIFIIVFILIIIIADAVLPQPLLVGNPVPTYTQIHRNIIQSHEIESHRSPLPMLTFSALFQL